MAGGKQKMLLAVLAALLVGPLRIRGFKSKYPEAQLSLRKYQDISKCCPDVGQWICMYRNYYSDPNFGGPSKCLAFKREGTYKNSSDQVIFTFGQNGSTNGSVVLKSAPCNNRKNVKFSIDDKSTGREVFNIIYVDCKSCAVVRHRYADNGLGCSLWRRAGTLYEPNDGCEFIYDENCGSSPKYDLYDPETCNF